MLKLYVIFDQYPDERRPIVVREDGRYYMAETNESASIFTPEQIGEAIGQFHASRPISYRYETDPVI